MCGDIEEMNTEKAVELTALKDHAAALITELRQAAAGVARAGARVAGSSRVEEQEGGRAQKTQPPPAQRVGLSSDAVGVARQGLELARWLTEGRGHGAG